MQKAKPQMNLSRNFKLKIIKKSVNMKIFQLLCKALKEKIFKMKIYLDQTIYQYKEITKLIKFIKNC